LKCFSPNFYVNSIYEIDLNSLKALGIKLLILDLDNTLVECNKCYVAPKLVPWLNKIYNLGFKLIIVSNNTKERVATFAKKLGLPFVHTALKPLSFGFKKAMATAKVSKKETAVIGDQLLTDVFGGNMLGLYTILVKPLSLKGESFFTSINRKIERVLLFLLTKRGYFNAAKRNL